METQEEYKQENRQSTPPTSKSAQYPIDYSESTEGQIDLIALFKEIYKRRRIVFISLAAMLLLGFIIALTSPEQYTTEIRLMPQAVDTKDNASSILKQLGGLSGVNFGSASGTINPMLYPDIASSSPFYLYLIDKPLYFSTIDTTLTLQEYFTEIDEPTFLDNLRKYTLGLPKIIIRIPIRLFTSDSVIDNKSYEDSTSDTSSEKAEKSLPYAPKTISIQELAVTSELRGRIETEIEPSGTLKVSSTMPDPLVAAKVTELAVNYLTDYIVDYRVEKAQQDLDFITQQYEEKKDRYNRAQQQLATIRDRNANLVSERGRVELERAETEYNMAFDLYQSVVQQLEQAKVRVQEETPVFKILEPIQVPLRPSQPKSELIIILSAMAGIAIGVAIIIIQIIHSKVKSHI
ncbi:MAG: Wzz/FepE/Etk N-terminal domain-containing protein [Cyclobacteriaceae bacterium]